MVHNGEMAQPQLFFGRLPHQPSMKTASIQEELLVLPQAREVVATNKTKAKKKEAEKSLSLCYRVKNSFSARFVREENIKSVSGKNKNKNVQ